jgi:hypothetical protein
MKFYIVIEQDEGVAGRFRRPDVSHSADGRRIRKLRRVNKPDPFWEVVSSSNGDGFGLAWPLGEDGGEKPFQRFRPFPACDDYEGNFHIERLIDN